MRLDRNTRAHRWLIVASMIGCVSVAGIGSALAVSGGGYAPSQQDCTPGADRNTTLDSSGNPVTSNDDGRNTEAGCHNFAVNLEDANGKRYAEFGLNQLPNGPGLTPTIFSVGQPGQDNFTHAGCASVNPNGTGGGTGIGCGPGAGTGLSVLFDIYKPGSTQVTPPSSAPGPATVADIASNGLQVYIGADDNLDAGEHDGVDGRYNTDESFNGPSDGGAVSAHLLPGQAATTPTGSNPVPVVGAGEGFCADGYCQDVTTYRQVVYRGNPNGDSSRNVYDYSGKKWDPYNCSSGDVKSEQACMPVTDENPNGSPDGAKGGMDAWRKKEAHSVYAEPGVQVYEDPDPQGSPVDPIFEAGGTKSPGLYPIPGLYAGTCGVTAGGGPVAQAPPGPVTNSVGQAQVSSGAC